MTCAVLAPALSASTPLLSPRLSVDPVFGAFPLLGADGKRVGWGESEEWD